MQDWALNLSYILFVVHYNAFRAVLLNLGCLRSFLKMSRLGPIPRDSDLIGLGGGAGKGIFEKHSRCFKCAYSQDGALLI